VVCGLRPHGDHGGPPDQTARLLHLLHSTASGDLAFYIQPPSTFVFTPMRDEEHSRRAAPRYRRCLNATATPRELPPIGRARRAYARDATAPAEWDFRWSSAAGVSLAAGETLANVRKGQRPGAYGKDAHLAVAARLDPAADAMDLAENSWRGVEHGPARPRVGLTSRVARR
jgi:hypothetical protein